MKLWSKILLAICLGIASGYVLGDGAEALRPIGTLFISLMSCIIVPLIFSSMVMGVVSSPDAKKLGRVGGISILLYIVSTAFAIALGIALANGLGLGSDLHLTATSVSDNTDLPQLRDLLLSVIPRNPVQSFAEGNVLQIIVFSILFGFALKFSGEHGKPLVQLIDSLSKVMIRFTHMVMAVSPIGVFALMAWATGTLGLEVLLPVGKFLFSYYLAALLFLLIPVSLGIALIARLSPVPFFKGMTEAICVAISTCSSSATLPATIQCANERLGVSLPMSQFLLPLGTSLNMNGSSLFQTMSAIFIANVYGIELAWTHYIILATTVGLASIGTASVPGGGLMMLSIVLSSLGIPIEGIALLAGVDRLRDMATTTVNITSDAACTLVVAKLEGDFDASVYHQTAPKATAQLAQ